MHNGFHPKSIADRLCLSRIVGSRGLIRVQDTVETAILELRNYVRNAKERLLIAARTLEHEENRETPNKYKKRKKNEKKTQWSQKQLHWQFMRQATGKASKGRWGWQRKRYLKRTETLLMAAQEQAIRTNNKSKDWQDSRKQKM